jgi:type IV pilus assembly protein PilV
MPEAKKMRSKTKRGHVISKNEGFTLLEVMIALVILSVGLLGLAALQLVAVKSNSFSSEMTYATMIAQQQIESLKSLPFTDGNLTPGSHTPPTPPNSKGVQYIITWTVTDNAPATNMKTIALTVTWQSLRQGKAIDASTVTANLQTVLRNPS